MDNRVLIWMAVAMVWVLVYQAWQRDFGPQAVDVPDAQDQLLPNVTTEDSGTGVDALAPPTLNAASPTQNTEQSPQNDIGLSGQNVKVKTDVYDLMINTTGATIHDVTLLNYPKQKDTPDDKVLLLPQASIYATALQTGLLASAGLPSPTHDAVYTPLQSSYEMGTSNELKVSFRWSEDDVAVVKTYTFYRGRYNIDLEQEITNNGDTVWSGTQYAQLKGNSSPTKRSMVDVDSYSFVGSVVYDGESYEKYSLKDLKKKPLQFAATNGWIANIQHHFLSAVIPPANQSIDYTSRTPNSDTMLVSGVAPIETVQPGSSKTFNQQLFIGPKIQEQMEQTAPGLKLSVDYGMLTVIAIPMFWLLNKIHSVVGNWGWAIILLTILIKLAFYPLAEKAGRSTAKMRTVAPRMKSIQERYKDDKQAQSRAMMELYKKEKINPAAGCLPILIQMPVFLALYWVLIESVELRQAPFMFWLQDLSSRDPYFILPIIMAGAMFVQTKLNPTSPDPTMAKVMTFMPIIMSVFFMFFPAGLVLYWVVNTVLSVAQQWRINKVVEAQARKT